MKNNIQQRGRSYEQDIPPSYLEKIQSGYLDYIKHQQDMRILIIDSNRLDFVKNENDYRLLVDVIDRDYAIGIHKISLPG